ncbi:MAG: hypothetical protein V4529_17015 [Gemmatimonadota bacterium]
MSLLDVLRGGVAIANKVTRPLQATVMYQRKTTADGYGPTLAAAVPLHASVDYKKVQVRTQDGTLSTTRSIVTLLDIAEVVAATAGLGIGTEDRFTMPDGSSGPILDLGGFIDAGTGHPIATEVMLG